MRRTGLAVVVALAMSAVAVAQPYAPLVTLKVTLPDGHTQELAAPESGLASITSKDGTEYSFRPTIQDSAPWNRIVVTIFRGATATEPTQVIGEVEVTRGAPAVETKTAPSFKVAVRRVSAPNTSQDATSETGAHQGEGRNR